MDVIETLAELMLRRGVPEHIRSDNGPKFTAKAVRAWLGRVCKRRSKNVPAGRGIALGFGA